MKKDDWVGIFIVVGIIGVALVSGAKGSGNGSLVSVQNQNPAQNSYASPIQTQTDIGYKLNETQYKVEELKKQIQAEEDKKNNSQYYGLVDLRYVNRSTDPKQEYIVLQVAYDAKNTIPLTGWTLKSLSTGISIALPKATYLFFSGMANGQDDIYLEKGQTVYVVTGSSPVGESFRVNKCSGYLNQFQTFSPYLSSNCPLPRNENLSNIPKTVSNDACLDHIDYFPACRIQTEPLPASWSSECNNFIHNKINYASCVDTHRNDYDFYVNEWRVFLRRPESIWKNTREEIVLYDQFGKVVDTLKY